MEQEKRLDFCLFYVRIRDREISRQLGRYTRQRWLPGLPVHALATRGRLPGGNQESGDFRFRSVRRRMHTRH